MLDFSFLPNKFFDNSKSSIEKEGISLKPDDEKYRNFEEKIQDPYKLHSEIDGQIEMMTQYLEQGKEMDCMGESYDALSVRLYKSSAFDLATATLRFL